LSELSKRLVDMGLVSAYHHHMGTVVETADEIDALMAASDTSLGLLLDTGHATFAGVDPLDLARGYKDRITHVHCKDVRADRLTKARQGSFLDGVIDGVFTVPGDGSIDYPPILEVMADRDYDGWVVVEAEQDPEKADPATYAHLGFRNLSRLCDEAGLV
jgi:inosose dehydratase